MAGAARRGGGVDATPAPEIVVDHADKAVGPYDVLVDVSLRAAAGRTTVVVSPFSMGATTLLQAMLGMVTLDTGRITVGELSITTADYGELQALQRDSGVLFLGGRVYGASTVSTRTVEESVRGVLAPDLPAHVVDERVAHHLADFGLSDASDRLLPSTSIAVARRATVARVFVTEPGLMVLDEPGTGLDDAKRAELAACLHRARSASTATIVLGTSDLVLARALGDRVVVLRHGTVVADGPVDDVLGPDEDLAQLAERLGISAEGADDEFTRQRRRARQLRDRQASLLEHAAQQRLAALREWSIQVVVALAGLVVLVLVLSGKISGVDP